MTLALSPAGRRYGYHSDTPDHRDFGVGRLSLSAPTTRKANNLALMGPVLNQGSQGSCTAHAAAADREFLHWKELARQGKPGWPPGPDGLFSPSFIYYLERQQNGTLPQGDCGSDGRTSCQVLNQCGCALRAVMPYSETSFSTAPTPSELATAKLDWPAGGYHRLATVDDMRSVIASGYNFRLGFTVFRSFESDWSVKGYMPIPKVNEPELGGHEVLAVGYDDDESAFLIRNSWGADWGLSGNFWFPYAAAADPRIFGDAWVQHLGKW